MPDNPLNASPAELAKLETHAARKAEISRREELARRGIRPTIEDLERETSPDTYSRKQLARRGIEAGQLTRSAIMGGASMQAGAIVLPLPITPPPGFIREANLSGLTEGVDYTREGTAVVFLDAVRVAGQRFREGDKAEVFPEADCDLPGFVRPSAFLDAIRSGLLEPVTLEPAATSQE